MSTASDADGVAAPWFSLPEEAIMSVEHPCIVKNTAKGIDMLGGPRALSQTLDQGTERTLALSFAPDDPSRRTVLSLHHQTNDVLLKITVPKRTGRKRKRGSDQPFSNDVCIPVGGADAFQLVTSMRDNPKTYTAETVGIISSSHVWRSMPDFAFSSRGSSFFKHVEQTLLPKDYSLMKQFHLTRKYGITNPENVPPPIMSTQSMPYHYFYRQNQAVSKAPDADGAAVLVNRAATAKTFTHQWLYDNEQVPDAPMKECPPLEDQPQQTQDIVRRLRPLFEERPLWTRRALLNQLPDSTPFFFAKNAMAYVAFTIRSGPWRDTLCQLGIDPRTDRKYRKYQTILLQLMHIQKDLDQPTTAGAAGRHWVRNRDTKSHIFSGSKIVPDDGKVWQLCDLEDEQLKSLVDIEDLYLRPECEIRYFGWYPNGAYAKLKILLKVKVDRLIAGKSIEPSIFDRFMQLPDSFDTNNDLFGMGSGELVHGYMPKDATKDELDWATSYRGVVKTPVGALPIMGAMGRGRSSVPKPKARPSYIDSEMDVDGDEDEDDDEQEDSQVDATDLVAET